MFADNYPPPKYEDVLKNDNVNCNVPSTTLVSSFHSQLLPLTTTNMTNIGENIGTGPPFRVNLISSITPMFGPNPIETDCPYCQVHIVTSIQRIVGALPWIVMGICFLFGFLLFLPWCLCFVPFYMDNCRDVIHSCPSCKRILGRFTRI